MINVKEVIKKSLKKGFINSNCNGFTIVELIIVIGIFAILTMFVTINLLKPQLSFNLDSSVNLLASDIKSQQAKAMSGSTDGYSIPQNFGIYLGSDSYTLFTGSSYNPLDTKNFVVKLDNGATLSSNIPSSQIVFDKLSGEILSYTPFSKIEITHSSGDKRTIDLSLLGVVSLQ